MTSSNQTPAEVLGIFITKHDIGNMHLEHIHVSDYAIQNILKTVRLNKEAQEEAVDKLYDRTPNWMELDTNTQFAKIKTVLTQETVIEYLRLHEEIRSDVDMLEVGIDTEGSLVVSAFYVDKTKVPEELQQKEMTKEEMDRLETQLNILDGSMNIYEEAKKKFEKLNQDGVLPFPNRAARRKAQKK